MMRTLHLKALRTLATLKFQTGSTALLIACGSGLWIASWSSYQSLREAQTLTYHRLRFGEIFAEVKQAPLSLRARILSIPGVRDADLRLVLDAQVRLPGAPDARLISLPAPGEAGLDLTHLVSGRVPEPGSLPEALIHPAFAEARGLAPGAEFEIIVQGGIHRIRISGVALSPDTIYALGPGSPLPDDEHFAIFWLRRVDLERLAKQGRSFQRASIALAPGADGRSIRNQLDRLLLPYGGPGSTFRDEQASHRLLENEIREQRTLALVLPMIFLWISGFLIHGSMSRLISLERLQIATLRALGYTAHEIRTHYHLMVALMGSAGAGLGIGIGWGLGALLARSYRSFFRFPEIRDRPAAVAWISGCAIALLPGVLSTARALAVLRRTPPAQAMRPPPPPSFHRSWLDQTPLGRKISIPSRVVLRNLLSRPLRLLGTITGLSCAGVILLMALSWSDLLDELLEEQFHRQSREELSMSLRMPVEEGRILEWKSLPGLLQSETQRILPVRMEFQHHSRRLVLKGSLLHPDLEIPSGEVRSVPPRGLLLSRTFQSSWGIQRGDRVRFRSLEGDSREFEVEVADFFHSRVGLQARILKSELHRLLREEPCFNRVLLRIRPETRDQILGKIRMSPSFFGVWSKSTLQRSFEQTLGTLIRISSLILLLFALILAGSILLHSLRISLSERQREIASLRVLGLPFEHAFRLLLAETGIQFAIALPLGWIGGTALTRFVLRAMHEEEYDFEAVISLRSYAIVSLILGLTFLAGTLRIRALARQIPLASAMKTED